MHTLRTSSKERRRAETKSPAPVKPPAASDLGSNLRVAHAKVKHEICVEDYLDTGDKQTQPSSVVPRSFPALSPVIEPVSGVLDFPREGINVEVPCIQDAEAPTCKLVHTLCLGL